MRHWLTLHTARAWSPPQAWTSPWPAGRSSRHSVQCCGPGSSPSQRSSCGCYGETVDDMQQIVSVRPVSQMCRASRQSALSCLVSIFELCGSLVGSLPPFCYSFLFTLRLITALLASAGTHSAADGAKGHEALGVVGQRPAVGLPVGVLAPLQDELLALEVMMLETQPTVTWVEEVKAVSQSAEQKLAVWNRSEHTTDRRDARVRGLKGTEEEREQSEQSCPSRGHRKLHVMTCIMVVSGLNDLFFELNKGDILNGDWRWKITNILYIN